MDFTLTETQLALQKLSHEFAEKEIRPVARDLDRIADPHARFPWDILEKGSRLGLRTLSIPEERGGGGASILDLCIVGEEIAWGDLGVAVTFDQTWKVSHFVDRLAGEEQRARFLPAFLADHRFHMAVGMTEPDTGGTENFGLPHEGPGLGAKARAGREGNDWVINGTKHFISNGGIARLYLLFLRTDPAVGISEGTTYFMVGPEVEGFSIGRIHEKMGQRLSQNAELIFRDCRVPDADRMTPEGGAMKARGGAFTRGMLIESASTVLGPARAAYEDTVEYAGNRVQGGKPLSGNQGVGFALADCFIDLQASRRILHYAAWASAHDDIYDPKLGFMAKCFASESCFRVARRAMEIWGGMGHMTESPMEKYLRDAASFLHSAGTNQTMRLAAMRRL